MIIGTEKHSFISIFLLFPLTLSPNAAWDILQLWQSLFSQHFVWRLPGGYFPCMEAPLAVGLSCSHPLLFLPLSTAHGSSHSHPASVGRSSRSYLSQADVSKNCDLHVWLVGNGSSTPPLIGNLQSRESTVKVSNSSSPQALRSGNLPWQSGGTVEWMRGPQVGPCKPWHSSDEARLGPISRDRIPCPSVPLLLDDLLGQWTAIRADSRNVLVRDTFVKVCMVISEGTSCLYHTRMHPVKYRPL